MRPLEGIRVLDLSTLLPGPLATLILAEAGAEVIKVERPGRGDEMRTYVPKFGTDSSNFALLNRGKRSLAVDLKAEGAVALLTPLLEQTDVLVEQFRPGVLDRLGLGYEAVRAINPRIIYASITGWGASGPHAETAAHDLNFCAQTGMLDLTAGSDGTPGLPAALVGDIAGGTYPAIMNILMALLQRERTGEGCQLEIAMADNLFTLMYWAIGSGLAAGEWPRSGGELVTGGSPRYNIYRTADGRFIAAAPIEEKFWINFCDAIGLDAEYRDDSIDPQLSIRKVGERIAGATGSEWEQRFAGKDVCATLVVSLERAMQDPHFTGRGVFDHTLGGGVDAISALPVPVSHQFRGKAQTRTYPELGEGNAEYLGSD